MMDRTKALATQIARSPQKKSFVWLAEQLQSLTTHLQTRKEALASSKSKDAQDWEWIDCELTAADQQLQHFREIVLQSARQANPHSENLQKEMDDISKMSAKLEKLLRQTDNEHVAKSLFDDQQSKDQLLSAYERARLSIDRLGGIRKELAAVEDALDDMEESPLFTKLSDLEKITQRRQKEEQVKRQPKITSDTQEVEKKSGVEKSTPLEPKEVVAVPLPKSKGLDIFSQSFESLNSWSMGNKKKKEVAVEKEPEEVDVASQVHKSKERKPSSGLEWDGLLHTLQGLGDESLTVKSVETTSREIFESEQEAPPTTNAPAEQMKNTRSLSYKTEPYYKGTSKPLKIQSLGPASALVSTDYLESNPMGPAPPLQQARTATRSSLQPRRAMTKAKVALSRPMQWASLQEWKQVTHGGSTLRLPRQWAALIHYSDSQKTNADVESSSTVQPGLPKNWATVKGQMKEQLLQENVYVPRQWASVKAEAESHQETSTGGVPKQWAQMKEWTELTESTAEDPEEVDLVDSTKGERVDDVQESHITAISSSDSGESLLEVPTHPRTVKVMGTYEKKVTRNQEDTLDSRAPDSDARSEPPSIGTKSSAQRSKTSRWGTKESNQAQNPMKDGRSESIGSHPSMDAKERKDKKSQTGQKKTTTPAPIQPMSPPSSMSSVSAGSIHRMSPKNGHHAPTPSSSSDRFRHQSADISDAASAGFSRWQAMESKDTKRDNEPIVGYEESSTLPPPPSDLGGMRARSVADAAAEAFSRWGAMDAGKSRPPPETKEPSSSPPSDSQSHEFPAQRSDLSSGFRTLSVSEAAAESFSRWEAMQKTSESASQPSQDSSERQTPSTGDHFDTASNSNEGPGSGEPLNHPSTSDGLSVGLRSLSVSDAAAESFSRWSALKSQEKDSSSGGQSTPSTSEPQRKDENQSASTNSYQQSLSIAELRERRGLTSSPLRPVGAPPEDNIDTLESKSVFEADDSINELEGTTSSELCGSDDSELQESSPSVEDLYSQNTMSIEELREMRGLSASSVTPIGPNVVPSEPNATPKDSPAPNSKQKASSVTPIGSNTVPPSKPNVTPVGPPATYKQQSSRSPSRANVNPVGPPATNKQQSYRSSASSAAPPKVRHQNPIEVPDQWDNHLSQQIPFHPSDEQSHTSEAIPSNLMAGDGDVPPFRPGNSRSQEQFYAKEEFFDYDSSIPSNLMAGQGGFPPFQPGNSRSQNEYYNSQAQNHERYDEVEQHHQVYESGIPSNLRAGDGDVPPFRPGNSRYEEEQYHSTQEGQSYYQYSTSKMMGGQAKVSPFQSGKSTSNQQPQVSGRSHARSHSHRSAKAWGTDDHGDGEEPKKNRFARAWDSATNDEPWEQDSNSHSHGRAPAPSERPRPVNRFSQAWDEAANQNRVPPTTNRFGNAWEDANGRRAGTDQFAQPEYYSVTEKEEMSSERYDASDQYYSPDQLSPPEQFSNEYNPYFEEQPDRTFSLEQNYGQGAYEESGVRDTYAEETYQDQLYREAAQLDEEAIASAEEYSPYYDDTSNLPLSDDFTSGQIQMDEVMADLHPDVEDSFDIMAQGMSTEDLAEKWSEVQNSINVESRAKQNMHMAVARSRMDAMRNGPSLQMSTAGSGPSDLYKERSANVAASADAGKSRWGAMEATRAQQMSENYKHSSNMMPPVDTERQADYNRLVSEWGRRNEAEDKYTQTKAFTDGQYEVEASIMNQLAKEWEDVNSDNGASPMPPSFQAAPFNPTSMEDLAKEWGAMNQNTDNNEPPSTSTDQLQSFPKGTTNMSENYTSRTRNVAAMADAGKSRWGTMENQKAQQMAGSNAEERSPANLFKGRSLQVASAASAGKSRWGSMENQRAQQMVGEDHSNSLLSLNSMSDESQAAPSLSDGEHEQSRGPMQRLAQGFSSIFAAGQKDDLMPKEGDVQSNLKGRENLPRNWANIQAQVNQKQSTFEDVTSPATRDASTSRPTQWAEMREYTEMTGSTVADPVQPMVNANEGNENLPDSYQTVMDWAGKSPVPPTINNVVFQLRNFNVAAAANAGKSRWGDSENMRAASLRESVQQSASGLSDSSPQSNDLGRIGALDGDNAGVKGSLNSDSNTLDRLAREYAAMTSEPESISTSPPLFSSPHMEQTTASTSSKESADYLNKLAGEWAARNKDEDGSQFDFPEPESFSSPNPQTQLGATQSPMDALTKLMSEWRQTNSDKDN